MIIIIPRLHHSINQWKNWHHQKYNTEKRSWSDEIYYITRGKKGLNGKVEVVVKYYFKTKQKRDLDNYTPKFIMDGLVKAGMIEEDNSSIVTKLSVEILHDKENPRTEILINKQ